MRKSYIMALFALLFSLLYFSPQLVLAQEEVIDDEITEGNSGENTQEYDPSIVTETDPEANVENEEQNDADVVENEEIVVEEKETDDATKEAFEEEDIEAPEEKQGEEILPSDGEEVEVFSTFSAPVEEEDVLQKGVRDDRVIDLKIKLGKLGFHVSSNPTTYYGSSTEAAVRSFQDRYNLEVTGKADSVTLQKIDEILAGPMFKGMHRYDVVDLKVNLGKLGFHVSSNPTTYYGSSTERAVREFQSYYGVTGDSAGVAGDATVLKLAEIVSTPLQKGKRHNSTIDLKVKLGILGYQISSNPTTYYGSSTEKAVSDFQKQHNLLVNGIADPVTLKKIEETLSAPLVKGMRRADVVDLKVDLGKLGFHVSSNPTTYYGSSTEKAVKEFQSYYGITGDTAGVAGNATISKLNEIVSTPLQKGKRDERAINLKVDLGKLGFHVSSNPTTYYGSSTEAAIIDFQKRYNLRVNGIADPVTLKKIDEILSGPMFKGIHRFDVVDLKINLGKLGYHVSTNPTTYYGSSTEAAVKEFQSYYGVTGDKAGVAGDATVAKINEILSGPFVEGKRDAKVVDLKEKLNLLGFGPLTVSDHYDRATKQSVIEFQRYFDLLVNGIADAPTRAKMDKILSSPLRYGEKHPDVVKLKEDLMQLGYQISTNPTDYFGTKTEEQVKQFQRDYKLPVSGIADEKTLKKIAEIVKKNPNTIISTYNITLQQALDMQMKADPQTDHSPGYVLAQYTEITGELTGASNVRVQPSTKSNTITTLPKGTIVTILDKVKGEEVSTTASWYKIKYNGKERYIYGNLVKNITAKVNNNVNLVVRAETNTNSEKYALLKAGTEVSVVEFEGNGWVRLGYGWKDAHRENVVRFLNPDANDRYQHLDLSSNLGLSANQLNKFITSRLENLSKNVLKKPSDSVLYNQGGTFKKASAMPGQSINELYLISHAMLETGYGTSNLATGMIKVGEVSKNKWVAFIPENGGIVPYTVEGVVDKNGKIVDWIIKKELNFKEGSAKNIRSTYNMFGIEAVDSNPEIRGSVRAYREGWFSVEDAIEGGAQFIAGDYIHNQYNQNTLYKMRWNPAGMDSLGYATKQYATDIRWAVKQVNNIKGMLSEVNLLDSPILKFNVIKYKS